jgi:hypothetical protein
MPGILSAILFKQQINQPDPEYNLVELIDIEVRIVIGEPEYKRKDISKDHIRFVIHPEQPSLRKDIVRHEKSVPEPIHQILR